MTNFHAFLNSSSLSLLILGAGLALGGGLLLVLFFLIRSVITGGQANSSPVPVSTPMQSPQQRRTLMGLSWIIATTHQSVSQTVGLVMSFSSLIAIVLSVICAIAGVAIVSYQKFSSLPFTAIAALATLILATLIESLSLNALKSIRLSNEAIAQAEQAHYDLIIKEMEEHFEEDAEQFAQTNQQTLSKEDVAALKRAADFKQKARRKFEKKRHTLMRQQTRNARRTRNTSIPFAAAGVLFSASAGGLFWHTVLASLDLWLNLAIGTMFALVVSVTFVQSELLKRIKDDAIREALQSGEMQSAMLKQQSEDMVLEMVVDSMATVKDDPGTLQEMGSTIKDELKSAIKTLTGQTTSRLIEDTDGKASVKDLQTELPEKEKTSKKRQKKELEWLSHPALSLVLKRYPKLNEKVDSWRSAGRVSISILSLVNATNHTRKVVQNRIKDGTLKKSSHNPNLVLIASVLDWLSDVDVPVVSVSQSDPITDELPAISEPQPTVLDQPASQNGHREEDLSGGLIG